MACMLATRVCHAELAGDSQRLEEAATAAVAASAFSS